MDAGVCSKLIPERSALHKPIWNLAQYWMLSLPSTVVQNNIDEGT